MCVVCRPVLQCIKKYLEARFFALPRAPLRTLSPYVRCYVCCYIRCAPLCCAVLQCIKKFLKAQLIVAPSTFATGAITLLAPAYFYVLVHKMGLGLDGVATAFMLCELTGLVCIMGYLIW